MSVWHVSLPIARCQGCMTDACVCAMKGDMTLADVNALWEDCFLAQNAGLHTSDAAMSELMLEHEGLLISDT